MASEITHIVQQGETLASIAQMHGFSDWKPIFDHPGNRELKKKRPNPQVLFPGDQVEIPKKEYKEESVDTEKPFKVTIKKMRSRLIVAMKNTAGKPLENVPYVLIAGEERTEGKTDKEGLIQCSVDPSLSSAVLEMEEPKMKWDLRIGFLDPAEEQSGAAARLNNLGYCAGVLSDPASRELKRALEEFQCDNGLHVDGTLNSSTQSKLKEVHGC